MYNGMQSILGGPVIGLFTCALFFPAVDSRTALAGVASSLAVNFYLVGAHYRWVPSDPWSMLLHAYWVSFWVNVVFFATAALVELARALWRRVSPHGAYRYFKADAMMDAENGGQRLPGRPASGMHLGGSDDLDSGASGSAGHVELELAERPSQSDDDLGKWR